MKSTSLKIMTLGLTTPFLARIPGALFYDRTYLTAYFPSLSGVLFILCFSSIPFIALCILMSSKDSLSQSGLVGAGLVVFGLTFYAHAMLDLSSSSTAAIALVMIPIWTTAFLPVGYFFGLLTSMILKKIRIKR